MKEEIRAYHYEKRGLSRFSPAGLSKAGSQQNPNQGRCPHGQGNPLHGPETCRIDCFWVAHFLQKRDLKLLFGEQRCFPKPRTKMQQSSWQEEREGDGGVKSSSLGAQSTPRGRGG